MSRRRLGHEKVTIFCPILQIESVTSCFVIALYSNWHWFQQLSSNSQTFCCFLRLTSKQVFVLWLQKRNAHCNITDWDQWQYMDTAWVTSPPLLDIRHLPVDQSGDAPKPAVKVGHFSSGTYADWLTSAARGVFSTSGSREQCGDDFNLSF